MILKAARLYKKGQPKEEGELATCNEGASIVVYICALAIVLPSGGTQAEFVGALKEVFGKPKEFVHVDLDVELSKLGLKNLFPLDLWPPSRMCALRVLKKSLIHSMISVPKPSRLSVFFMKMWSILSKAFLKSIKSIREAFCFSFT